MHSSRIRTACSLTVSHSICHACSLPHMSPSATHTPLPFMPPTMHAPSPCHTHPPTTYAPLLCTPPMPCMPPAMHVTCHTCPLPCTPPATHAPCHAYPLPHTLHCHTCPPCNTCPQACTPLPLPHTPHPPTTHAPCHACPSLWTEFLTHVSENITLPQLRCGW